MKDVEELAAVVHDRRRTQPDADVRFFRYGGGGAVLVGVPVPQTVYLIDDQRFDGIVLRELLHPFGRDVEGHDEVFAFRR